MPAKKRSARKKGSSTSRRTAAKSVSTRRGRSPRTKGLQCPDCDFVAAHPMGLGRHRSARHGVQSLRQRRRETTGAWLTRREAARRAGVHYNTIRFWERSGRLRKSKTPTGRGTLVSAIDLETMTGTARRGRGPDGVDGARIVALERRFNDLLRGLERLVATAGAGTTPKRRGVSAASKVKRG